MYKPALHLLTSSGRSSEWIRFERSCRTLSGSPSVRPFRVFIKQFRPGIGVMNSFVGLFWGATAWRCRYDVNFYWGRSYHWILLLGVCHGASVTLLNTRLGVTRVVSTCCFFRAANGSWLCVSLKHTTFNSFVKPEGKSFISRVDC